MDLLFSERNSLRKVREQTDVIDREMYALLVNVCEKYIQYLIKKFPDFCPDNNTIICGVNLELFHNTLNFKVPGLFYDYSNKVITPRYEDYDQYALLDYIEYIGKNITDIKKGDYHSFFQHYHYEVRNSNEIFCDFQKEINDTFKLTGLLYLLSDNKDIERITLVDTQIEKLKKDVESLTEVGLKELINNAIKFYKDPKFEINQIAVEKLWDALERIKTIFLSSSIDKKQSVKDLINKISHNNSDYFDLFNTEFATLTKIGNVYRIRHHETDKIDIIDDKYYEYLFNRCLSLLALAVKFIK